MRAAEERVRLALQSVRAMRPTSAIDLDRQELAVGHLSAALRDPDYSDRRDYIDTGQTHLTDCPGYVRHCDGEKCNRCGHCGWTRGRHQNVQALRDCPGFASPGAACTVDPCTTCGYVENVHPRRVTPHSPPGGTT